MSPLTIVSTFIGFLLLSLNSAFAQAVFSRELPGLQEKVVLFSEWEEGVGVEGFNETCGSYSKDQTLTYRNPRSHAVLNATLAAGDQICVTYEHEGVPIHITGLYGDGEFSFIDVMMPFSGIAYGLPSGEIFAASSLAKWRALLKDGSEKDCRGFVSLGHRKIGCNGSDGPAIDWDSIRSVQLLK